MKHSKGFTLIEVMIVTAIIAILCALSVTIYLDSVSKAQISEAFTVADGMKAQVSEYFQQKGACPELGNAVGFPSRSTSYGGKYVASVDISPGTTDSCVLTVSMRGMGSVTPKLINKTVTLTLSSATSAESSWTCVSNADPKYLPQLCR